MIDGVMFIDLPGLKARGGERRLVGGVWPKLRLQTERSEALIGSAVLADFAVEPVAHVELNAGLIRIDAQRDACTMGNSLEDTRLHLAGLFGDDEIVIKRNGQRLVFVDGFEGAAFCEIEGRVCDGQRLASRGEIAVNFRMAVGRGPDLMVEAFVGGFAVEIEISVVGQIDDSRFVRCGAIIDLQRIVIRKCVDCFCFELSGEAGIAVRGDNGELQRRVANGRGFPHATAIAVTAMEGVAFVRLVQNELVFFAVKRE